MTLRPEYSLGHSPYNRFLFASVGLAPSGAAGESGSETGGEDVTVLSALTRLKVDPWAEAARLASLPPDVAGTARQLVALLPVGGLADVPPMPGARAASAKPTAGRRSRQPQHPKARPRSWLGWTILFVVMLALAFYLKPDNNLEPVGSNNHSRESR